MANDAMILSIDKINFTWAKAQKMSVYAVGIAADNRGKVMITEPPAVTRIRHLPKLGRPSVWDFAGDGYAIYQRTGGLADLVVAHLLVVRSRSRTRAAGEVIREVAGSDEAKGVVSSVRERISTVHAGGFAATAALNLLIPVADFVGKLIAKKKDRILQTISGSLVLTEERKALGELSQNVQAADGSMEVEADVMLFDSETDEDTVAETKSAETHFEASGLLFSTSG